MDEININVSEQWPYNLLNDLEIAGEDPVSMLDDTGSFEVAMALSTLTPREKRAVRLYYAGEKTFKAVGDELGISAERTRQVIAKAKRKLRNPKHSGYVLKYGVKAYIEKRINEGVENRLSVKQEELERLYQAKVTLLANDEIQNEIDERAKHLALTIEEMDLSVRGYNVLKRAGCNIVYDILTKYPDYEHVVTMRNLGRKTLEEIRNKLKTYGIYWPANYIGA